MNDGKRNAQRSMFGIMNILKPELATVGLNEEHVWKWVTGEHGVSSRSELDEQQLAIVSARLSAATRDHQLFLVLCEAVRTAVGTYRVFRGFNDGTFKKVHEGVITENIKERCQRYADATGCFLNVHGADSPDSRERFEPAEYAPDPNMPPFAPNDPNRPTKVFEIHRKGNETQTVEISFPDCSDLAGWGQRHADESGFSTIITDRMGHNVIMEFTATPAPAPAPTPARKEGQYVADVELVYSTDEFFDEFIQCGNPGSIIWAGKLHDLIHFGLGFPNFRSAREFERSVREQLRPFCRDGSKSGPWCGLQWKRNFEVDYPSRVVRYVPAESGALNYENELMCIPGSLSYRQRFGRGTINPVEIAD